MLYTKCESYQSFNSGKEGFKDFTIYGYGEHVDHET